MLSGDVITTMIRRSVDEAKKSIVEDRGVHPFVGAVIASKDGRIIATAHRGETGPGRHAEFIALSKAAESGVDLAGAELFVTLEPCTARGPRKTPCSDRIKDSGIEAVYIGMLDPNPQILGRGETDLRWAGIRVERFPGNTVTELERLNADFIKKQRASHLPTDSLYVTTQIPDIMIQQLQREGLEVERLPFDWHVSIQDVVHHCRSAYRDDVPWDLDSLVRKVRGLAFDRKYADYSYQHDARGIYPSWSDDLSEVLKRLGITSLVGRRVVDVGIGNGEEGEALFKDVADLTMVDIAPRSLEIASGRLPRATAIVAEAEDLRPIRAASQDIYISLRTYQSSYFDPVSAVREGYRVLRVGAILVVSVANAFVGQDDVLIPGLVIPNTSLVDRNRPFEVADQIRRRLTLMGFDHVGVHSGETEVYVYGRRSA